MSIESKEWWDVLAVGRYDEFDYTKDQAKQQSSNEKHYLVDSHSSVVPRTATFTQSSTALLSASPLSIPICQ